MIDIIVMICPVRIYNIHWYKNESNFYKDFLLVIARCKINNLININSNVPHKVTECKIDLSKENYKIQ